MQVLTTAPPPPLCLSPQVAMVREVTKLVRELKQWSEGGPEAPTTARGPAGGRRGGRLHAQAAPMTALGPASGGVGTGVVVGTGGRYRCLIWQALQRSEGVPTTAPNPTPFPTGTLPPGTRTVHRHVAPTTAPIHTTSARPRLQLASRSHLTQSHLISSRPRLQLASSSPNCTGTSTKFPRSFHEVLPRSASDDL